MSRNPIVATVNMLDHGSSHGRLDIKNAGSKLGVGGAGSELSVGGAGSELGVGGASSGPGVGGASGRLGQLNIHNAKGGSGVSGGGVNNVHVICGDAAGRVDG